MRFTFSYMLCRAVAVICIVYSLFTDDKVYIMLMAIAMLLTALCIKLCDERPFG